MIEKILRGLDRKLLNSFHEKKCMACGAQGCDPCHIKSRGSGGDDAEWNVIPLCRQHHSESHQLGWWRFACVHQRVMVELWAKGWEFNPERKIRRA